MARMVAIVALLLGLGATAYESFREPGDRMQPQTLDAAEGGSGWPTPPAN
jgi:hypothetical protein